MFYVLFIYFFYLRSNPGRGGGGGGVYLLEWGRMFSRDLGGENILASRDFGY